MTVIDPGPVVALHRAIAVGERDGAAAGLAELEHVAGDRTMQQYAVFHAAGGRLLALAGRMAEADAAYARAIELTGNPAERRALQRRRPVDLP